MVGNVALRFETSLLCHIHYYDIPSQEVSIQASRLVFRLSSKAAAQDAKHALSNEQCFDHRLAEPLLGKKCNNS